MCSLLYRSVELLTLSNGRTGLFEFFACKPFRFRSSALGDALRPAVGAPNRTRNIRCALGGSNEGQLA